MGRCRHLNYLRLLSIAWHSFRESREVSSKPNKELKCHPNFIHTHSMKLERKLGASIFPIMLLYGIVWIIRGVKNNMIFYYTSGFIMTQFKNVKSWIYCCQHMFTASTLINSLLLWSFYSPGYNDRKNENALNFILIELIFLLPQHFLL